MPPSRGESPTEDVEMTPEVEETEAENSEAKAQKMTMEERQKKVAELRKKLVRQLNKFQLDSSSQAYRPHLQKPIETPSLKRVLKPRLLPEMLQDLNDNASSQRRCA